MINEKMMGLGKKRSVIREIFEYGNKRRQEIGKENVYDFSLGNPSIPAPEIVKETILSLITEKDPIALHGYTSAQGDLGVRTAIAENITERFALAADPNLLYMTCGAAASLTISLNAVINEGDEVIVLAPFFPEYTVFIEKAGAKCVVVKCREEDFQIDFSALERAINKNTKAIIVNSPNNPCGVVLNRDTISQLAELLNNKQAEFGKEIYIIADEPYRELIYGDIEVPYIPNFYDNTLVCYSFSKSLSLPGERIGYVVVPNEASDAEELLAGIEISNRTLGFVNAPSMMQKAVAKCLEEPTDVAFYDRNRKLLYESLTKFGFICVKPEGAFYLWMKSPVANEEEFVAAGKKYNLLMVKGSAFGCAGYVRLAYCVSYEMIERSLPAFEKLAKDYDL